MGYSNGAVVPFDPAHHSVYSAYPYAYNFGLYGKKKREADPAYLVNTYAAYHPSTYYAGYHPYGLVHQPLVAHLNGAVVPAEPIENVEALKAQAFKAQHKKKNYSNPNQTISCKTVGG